MNRKWLAYFSVCVLALGLIVIVHGRGSAQAQAPAPPPPPPALAEGSTEPAWVATEPFDVFTTPADPGPGLPVPDPMSGDVFFYSAEASTDMAFAGPMELPEFDVALPFPGPESQGGAVAGGVSFVGPDPQDTITFVGFEAGLGNQVVTGAPYSATITSEFLQTLPDGNKIERKTTTTVYRDSQGRTRREQTLPAIGQYAASSSPPQAIFINDPVAGVSYILDPARKTARKMTRPNMRFFTGGPEGPGRGLRRERRQDPNVTTESLGAQNIEGILVQGTRVTRTIPAGRVGNQNPIVVTSERWYSPDLKLNLSVKNMDPMRGTNSTNLTNLRRDEPPASLFQVPSDYTVKEQPNRMLMRGQSVAPPPVPPQQ